MYTGGSPQWTFTDAGEMPEKLLVFYHADTLRQISALRKHLLNRERTGALNSVDRWIPNGRGESPNKLKDLNLADWLSVRDGLRNYLFTAA
jgi:hypothetical protein